MNKKYLLLCETLSYAAIRNSIIKKYGNLPADVLNKKINEVIRKHMTMMGRMKAFA